ncbi:F-box domain-containing protein [Aaosphaeria arxii CBS 175.79]|uniref:F-box domain-containing protein n=1 Tax=Aaosphaeria arxii CBS 175.79 TaxID=1450172 RepID=A0A6A5XD36_9PLEO|nr:F-box domain-containing protein [Aaosphaeria arxii CBS 175.79]KAF2010810.1 F-box domain-containing protein [Aaosphaeria arxii CBS 175.79]
MPGSAFSKEDYLSHLSHRPKYILRGVITLGESPKLSMSKIQRQPQLSFGLLDNLPLELLHAIISYLDLGSLSRISQVSLRGRVIIESLPAYRDLATVAGHIAPALSQTRLIGLHSVTTLQAALRSDRCISCGQYGAYLFLLSSEGCCLACLTNNQSLWLIPLSVARDCFDLTRQQLKDQPIMRSIPGTYAVRTSKYRARPIRLISVRIAKELAIKVHGSAEAVARNLAAKRLNMTLTKFREATLYQDAPLLPFSQDPLTLESLSYYSGDSFEGMGAITFPSMSGNDVENGLWCRGCERNFELYDRQKLDRDVEKRLTPPGSDGRIFWRGLQYRARSEAEFLEHARHCYSAAEVITRRYVRLT